MKRIFIVSLVSLALFGCGEDKITKEYLLGNWHCVGNEYEKENSDANEDFDDSVSSSEKTMTFKMLDNELYQINEDGTKILIDPNKMDTNKSEVTENAKINTKTTTKIVNSDTFNFTILAEINKINSNNNNNIIDLRTKTEVICTRIK
ncbi:hypothetical protein [Gilliamella sp. Pas-s95]|uniref:hypothetical protein n=1 Tax=Gilliamella sp. Pas-s95 TaxID=2687317 RepID=UPI0013284A68|nr:hypothetical protein [Gilliamella sp. Pas-s95]MWN04942.1 hypothetical protein [Gilliamella sp. Pas-s95]